MENIRNNKIRKAGRGDLGGLGDLLCHSLRCISAHSGFKGW